MSTITSGGYSARSDDAVLVRGKENLGTDVKSAPAATAATAATNPTITGTRGTTLAGTTPRDVTKPDHIALARTIFRQRP
jgi:hypothetical protein